MKYTVTVTAILEGEKFTIFNELFTNKQKAQTALKNMSCRYRRYGAEAHMTDATGKTLMHYERTAHGNRFVKG